MSKKLIDGYLETFEGATLSRWESRRVHGRQEWSGSVYYEGRLLDDVPRIQGARGADAYVRNDADLGDVGPVGSVTGLWHYGGNWINHFGHFLMETLTRFYGDSRGVDGVLCHPPSPSVKPWQRYLVSRLGWTCPIQIVRTPLAVERLRVTTPQVQIDGQVTSTASQVWSDVAFAPRPRRKVFLSRSRLANRQHRESVNDDELDRRMEAMGFEVIFPEQLDIRDQLSMLAEVETLVGVSGSALHLCVFMSKDSRVIDIGDVRSAYERLPMQQKLLEATGQPSSFIPFVGDRTARIRDIESTTERVREEVRQDR